MFKLGDYVVLNKGCLYKSRLENEIGRIVAIRDFDYVINFELSNSDILHECDIDHHHKCIEEYYERVGYGYLKLKNKKGLYLDECDLILINKKKGNSNLFR